MADSNKPISKNPGYSFILWVKDHKKGVIAGGGIAVVLALIAEIGSGFFVFQAVGILSFSILPFIGTVTAASVLGGVGISLGILSIIIFTVVIAAACIKANNSVNSDPGVATENDDDVEDPNVSGTDDNDGETDRSKLDITDLGGAGNSKETDSSENKKKLGVETKAVESEVVKKDINISHVSDTEDLNEDMDKGFGKWVMDIANEFEDPQKEEIYKSLKIIRSAEEKVFFSKCGRSEFNTYTKKGDKNTCYSFLKLLLLPPEKFSKISIIEIGDLQQVAWDTPEALLRDFFVNRAQGISRVARESEDDTVKTEVKAFQTLTLEDLFMQSSDYLAEHLDKIPPVLCSLLRIDEIKKSEKFSWEKVSPQAAMIFIGHKENINTVPLSCLTKFLEHLPDSWHPEVPVSILEQGVPFSKELWASLFKFKTSDVTKGEARIHQINPEIISKNFNEIPSQILIFLSADQWNKIYDETIRNSGKKIKVIFSSAQNFKSTADNFAEPYKTRYNRISSLYERIGVHKINLMLKNINTSFYKFVPVSILGNEKFEIWKLNKDELNSMFGITEADLLLSNDHKERIRHLRASTLNLCFDKIDPIIWPALSYTQFVDLMALQNPEQDTYLQRFNIMIKFMPLLALSKVPMDLLKNPEFNLALLVTSHKLSYIFGAGSLDFVKDIDKTKEVIARVQSLNEKHLAAYYSQLPGHILALLSEDQWQCIPDDAIKNSNTIKTLFEFAEKIPKELNDYQLEKLWEKLGIHKINAMLPHIPVILPPKVLSDALLDLSKLPKATIHKILGFPENEKMPTDIKNAMDRIRQILPSNINDLWPKLSGTALAFLTAAQWNEIDADNFERKIVQQLFDANSALEQLEDKIEKGSENLYQKMGINRLNQMLANIPSQHLSTIPIDVVNNPNFNISDIVSLNRLFGYNINDIKNLNAKDAATVKERVEKTTPAVIKAIAPKLQSMVLIFLTKKQWSEVTCESMENRGDELKRMFSLGGHYPKIFSTSNEEVYKNLTVNQITAWLSFIPEDSLQYIPNEVLQDLDFKFNSLTPSQFNRKLLSLPGSCNKITDKEVKRVQSLNVESFKNSDLKLNHISWTLISQQQCAAIPNEAVQNFRNAKLLFENAKKITEDLGADHPCSYENLKTRLGPHYETLLKKSQEV